MVQIEISAAECTGCGRCVEACPVTQSAHGPMLAMRAGKAVALAEGECLLCGHCIAACPHDAIRHSELPLDRFPALEQAGLPSLASLTMLLRARRASRALRDKPVPRRVIEQLLEIATWAPSAHNSQPVRWLVLDEPARIAALSARTVAYFAEMDRKLSNPVTRGLASIMLGPAKVRAAEAGMPILREAYEAARAGHDSILHHAPVVLVSHTPKGDFLGRDNAVYQAYNVMLAAPRLGLETCPIGFVMVALAYRPMPEELPLPPDRSAQVVLTLGYPRHTWARVPPRRPAAISWNDAPAAH